MKTPALAILCFALSTGLSAQPYIHMPAQQAIAAMHATPDPMAAYSPTESSPASTAETAQLVPTSESLPPAEGHGVPNKAYSVRGGVSYVTANGIRFSNQEIGISVKHFFRSNEALEVILSTGWQYSGSRLTGLYEVQRPIGTQGFYWIWGVGAHTGMFKGNYWTGHNGHENYLSNGAWHSPSGSRYTLGISGMLGLEYHFTEAPFTIGLELKPSLDLLNMSHRYGDSAISVRYAF